MAILVFISAFLLRIVVQLYTGAFVSPQVWEYETAANNFLMGQGLTYNLYGTTYYSLLSPLYSAICIVVYALTGHSFLAIGLFQAVISSFICVIVFLLARHIFGNKTAIIAAILTVFHPGLLIYTSKLHPLVLDSLLICLICWYCVNARSKPGFAIQIKLGAAFGLAMLTRATVILFLPISWLWLVLSSRKKIFAYIFISFMILSPWLVRNYMIHKKILVVSSSANMFWRGNNELATGTALAASGKPMIEEANDFKSRIFGKSEMEQYRIFWEEGFKFVKADSVRFLSLTAKKIFYFWWFAPTSGSEYRKVWLDVYRIYYIIILTLAILGLFSIRKLALSLRYDVFLLLLMIFTIMIAQSLFYVETRHRWAIEPLLLIFTAQGIVTILKNTENKSKVVK